MANIVVPRHIKHSHFLFDNKKYDVYGPSGSSYGVNPNRSRFSRGGERTLITAVYNRIAMDSASIEIKHVRLDEEGRYAEDMNTALNNCLTVEANIDQGARAFFQDIDISMLDEGVIAVVPVVTDRNPDITQAFDIHTMRVARVIQWYPECVTVDIYNDKTGMHETINVPKKNVAIIENPFYTIMNEPNSTMQRLIRKLSLMDIIDEESSSCKLDLIVQLPYIVKSETKKAQAEERRKQIEAQLQGSRYGIAYIDGTEKVTQLNRSVENNMLKQVEYLTNLLYSQLGLTQEILNGSADENAMNNYYTRTVEPIVSAIVDEFHRKFLTRTARTQRQAIMFFRDPFRLVPVNGIADMADKFTRNEILTSNEFRQIIGRKPSTDPAADELRNKNISQSAEEIAAQNGNEEEKTTDDKKEV